MKTDTEPNDLFSLVNSDDLFQFLKEYATKHPEFGKELNTFLEKACLAPDSSKVFDIRQDVLDAFDDAVMDGRYGDWLNLHELQMNLEEVIEDARKLMELGNPEPALAAGIQMLDTLGEEFEEYQVDDSYGYADGIYQDATDLILNAVRHPKMPSAILDEYYTEIEESDWIDILHQYGFEHKSNLLMQWALITKTPEERIPMLNKMIESCSSNYELSSLVAQKIADLTELKQDKEADKTIRCYINQPQIRGIAIDRAVACKDFDEALRLADEGLMMARKDGYLGIEHDWMKRLLSIYEAMGDTAKQTEAAKDLFLYDDFSKEYYTLLKSLVPPQQWKAYISTIFDNAMSNPERNSNTDCIGMRHYRHDIDRLAAILIAEKEWERLYKLVVNGKQTKIQHLDKYAVYLKDHSAELLQLYDEKLRWFAEQGTGRDRYDSIVRSMLVMQKLNGGNEAAHTLADHFRQIYKKRRLMMELIAMF